VPRIVHFLLTVTLKSWWEIAAYTGVITVGAILGAIGVLAALPGDNSWWEFTRAVIIAAVIAPPFGIFGGWHLMRISSLSKELSQLVARDRLTKVASRDFFFSELATAPDRRGVVMMLDIDRFKYVNDTFGHLIGDQIVKQVAAILQQETRCTDIVCRFGGDEFVMFIENLAPSEAKAIGERIRKRVTSTIELPENDEPFQATVSIGVSGIFRAEGVEQAISDADSALYEAKRNGRNCVASFVEAA